MWASHTAGYSRRYFSCSQGEMEVVVNDRHPSAGPGPTVPAPDAMYGHYTPYEQQAAAYAHAGYDNHGYGTGQWDTTGQTQFWDTSGYATHQQTGQWDSGQWQWESGHSGSWDGTTGWANPSAASGEGTWGTDATGAHAHVPPQTWDTAGWGGDFGGQTQSGQTQTWDAGAYATVDEPAPTPLQHDPTLMTALPDPDPGSAQWATAGQGAASVADCDTRTMQAVIVPPRDGRQDLPQDARPEPPQSRNRRKGAPARAGYRPRRKALLTVAVPSVAVMGVAGIAAASVASNNRQDTTSTQAASAPDPSTVKLSSANNQLDTQLAGLSRGADDFASRASRTQERLDLKARQEEERKRKAEEAARKEAERPKFALPVNQHGLSAYFGQAGVNWMSVHTGIDFPVSYGTPVMAATDGTVRTQYNVAYGNMAIVTAPDGTETWYCHLSSTRMRSGQVKAGDVIAYSGNSGNSTGPHLHFEVRPGGSAVDPLPWLRGHDLDPT